MLLASWEQKTHGYIWSLWILHGYQHMVDAQRTLTKVFVFNKEDWVETPAILTGSKRNNTNIVVTNIKAVKGKNGCIDSIKNK